MIEIQKSETADTRTCDWSKVTQEQLLVSSKQHIGDVEKGFLFFMDQMYKAAKRHDWDKIDDIYGFHRYFQTGFKSTIWWEAHLRKNGHHLLNPEGVRDDVDLVDVMEMIIDCVMAGMGRSGSVYPLNISPEVLMRAFQNTVELLKRQVKVVEK